MPKVFVADGLSDKGLSLLRKAGLDVDVNTGRCEEELVEIIKPYDALLVRSATKVTSPIIEAGERLKLIGRAGVGVDNVDVPAASRRGIIVMNTPTGNIISAAEQTLAMLLALARNLPDADKSMKAGEWEKGKFIGVELQDKSLGIIGMGKVGQIVARATRAIGMAIRAFDPFLSERRARELCVELVGFDELLSQSDFITIHTPLTDKTRRLLNAEAIAKMKQGARLINCARGGIVDESALLNALKTGHLGGAALDVFETEPLPATSPLRSVPNLILSPHLGASTIEAQTKVAEDIAQQVVTFFKEGKILNAVNLGVMLTREIEPFAELSQMLGSLLFQIVRGRPQQIKCSAHGKIASYDTHALAVYALQGFLSNWSEQRVNLVNAELFAEERGLTVTEEKCAGSGAYASTIVLEVETSESRHNAVGTVFDGREPRIVQIDGFTLDLKPAATMLMMFYPDQPGMVGKFGTILGQAGINIASMDVGRLEKRGRACVALTLDDPVPPTVLDAMRKVVKSEEIYLVKL